MIGTVQSNINKYEANKVMPPPSTLLWYADYFQVSLDFIFGRTDQPQGAQIAGAQEARGGKSYIREEIREFVEMCFDPDNPMSTRMKVLLTRMLMDSRK